MRAIIFDLGNTLIDYHGPAREWLEMERRGFEAVHARLGDGPGSPNWEAFKAAMERSLAVSWQESVAGRANATLRAIVERALAELDAPIDEELIHVCVGDYCTSISSHATVFPDVPDALAQLHRRGYRLGLISNTFWPAEHHEADLERFGLRGYFDAMVFSSVVGVWKPDPRIFHHTLAALGTAPHEAVFVGDRLVDDIGGAQRAGLCAVLREHAGGDNDYAHGAALGIVPDARLRTLDPLPELVCRLSAR